MRRGDLWIDEVKEPIAPAPDELALVVDEPKRTQAVAPPQCLLVLYGGRTYVRTNSP